MHKAGVLLTITILAAAAGSVPAQPQVNCMPTYYTWPGQPVTLWGNVSGGTAPYTYEWDFGEGTPASGAVGDTRYIAETYTYTTLGPRTATLTVTDANMDTDVDHVQIQVLPDSWETRRLAAIENGLRWLYRQQNADGAWHYDYWLGATAVAVLAFEDAGHRPNGDPDVDIYVDTVVRGLQYIFDHAGTQAIGPQTYIPDPDTNGNGIGIYFNSGRYMYEQGMCMMAIVGSGTPTAIASSGNPDVDGRTYFDIVQDAADLCFWAQNDSSGGHRGGWRYTPNYGSSDNSVSQWPAIGIEAAETHWGIQTVPESKSELLLWLAYSQNANGGFGYTRNNEWVNIAKTGSGICQLAYCDIPTSDTRVTSAIGFITDNWNSTTWDYGNIGDCYAMYAVAKGARISLPPINTFGTHDYWHEYTEWLYSHQNAAGDIQKNMSPRLSSLMTTAFGVLIMLPGIADLPPVAVITAPDEVSPDSSFPMSGDNSWHQDPDHHIVEWLWDFDDSDGLDWDNPDAEGRDVTNPGYSLPEGVPEQTFTVTLRVRDEIDQTDTDSHQILVSLNNHPPVADPGGPYSAQVGEVITLDGSASYDPDEARLGDHIVSWEWDLDGDGEFDDATGETVQHSWDTIFSGYVGLVVTDTYGAQSDPAQGYVTIWTSNVDAFVEHGDISFQLPPAKGMGSVTATIHVDCDSDPIEEIAVQFYNGDPAISVNPIGGPHVLTDLQPCGAYDVVQELDFTGNVIWDVYVVIDPNQQVEEFDEDNNKAHAAYGHSSSAGAWSEGWVLMSLPLVPSSFDPEVCLDDVAQVILLDTCLMRFDPGVGYRMYAGDWQTMEMQRGYWLRLYAYAEEDLFGVPLLDDQVVPLGTGWVIAPMPFNADIAVADLKVTDGVDTLSLEDAVAAGWLDGVFWGYPAGSYVSAPGDDDYLHPWWGYWTYVVQPGLSLIYPAP